MTSHRSPRLLRIITRLNVGGPATHVVVADRGLRDRGWETLLAHGEIDGDEAEVDTDALRDLPTVRLSQLRRPIHPVHDAMAFATLVRLIRRHRPDVIHTHLSKAGLLGRAAAIAVSPAARVHTFHGTLFGGYFGDAATGAIVRAERFLGHRTDRVLALSERQRAELLAREITDDARIRIVPLGVSLDRFSARDRDAARGRLGIGKDVPCVVAVGRLVPIKRLDRLLRAFASVHAEHPSARLYLVGDGPMRARLGEQVVDANLSASVTFAGWARDPSDWYAASDLVVLTSDSEGTPLALIEAAASARPVVATNVGGVSDVVLEDETGYVVERDDETRLAERMSMLIGDPGLRERLGAAAPGRAARYSAERLVSDLDSLYRELLAERRRAPG